MRLLARPLDLGSHLPPREAQLAKFHWAFEKLHLKEGYKLMDIGCGCSDWLWWLKNEKRMKVVGLNVTKARAVLGEDCLLNTYLTSIIGPGETPQPAWVTPVARRLAQNRELSERGGSGRRKARPRPFAPTVASLGGVGAVGAALQDAIEAV